MKKLVLLICLFMVACGNTPDEMSILDKSTCKLPCWNGIVPGKTSEVEILKFLESSPDIDPETINNGNQPWDIFDNQIFWTLGQGSKIEGESRISNNTVSDLILCGGINTSIGELVEQIGEPEGIISGNNFYGGRTVILVHPQKGVSYWYTTELNALEIQPDTTLDCLKIFDPSLYEEMLEAKFFSAGYYNGEETLKVMYPWDGYGNLDEKYPPRQP